MISLLSQSPLLLLFIVLACGAVIGKLKIGGINLGIAAVLFTGLGFGALGPDIKLPAIVYEIGLVLFIYCIGISSGEQFFGNLKKKGWSENLLVLGMILFATALVLLFSVVIPMKSSYLAGIFAGSLTNTPALAAAIEFIRNVSPVELSESIQAEPVVAYSVTYPVGVIGMILAIVLFQKLFKTSLTVKQEVIEAEKITNATVLVTQPESIGKTIGHLKSAHALKVVFGRMQRNGATTLAMDGVALQANDLITVVGKPAEVTLAIKLIGERSSAQLDMNHSELEMRRIFVSSPELIGQRLKDLNLTQTMGILITRLRRGDRDFVPSANTTLHFGDRVRILTHKDQLVAASKFFGDSYSAQSTIDILTLSLGVALGFFLGMTPIPLPGGITLKLGIAGGPLIVALILGAINRVGKLVFVMPFSSNNTIRQLGLVLFLAGIGTRSGYAFKETILYSNDGQMLLVLGTIVTLLTGFIFLFIGHQFLKIPFPRLAGMLSGLQTQPAVLAFVHDQAGSEQPNIGYAAVFPIAILSKIILVQILLSLLI
jgi:putative transport protein